MAREKAAAGRQDRSRPQALAILQAPLAELLEGGPFVQVALAQIPGEIKARLPTDEELAKELSDND